MLKNQKNFLLSLIILYSVILLWTGFRTKDLFTWFLEVLPAVLGIIILAILYPKLKLTNLTYFFVFVYCFIMAYGGEYTYAKNPLFNFFSEIFNLSRNYYDRLGHFMQGLVPALITREVIIRKKIIKGRGWIALFTVTVCLSASVIYEFFEWWMSLAAGESAMAFLGTQGDIWDTHWDMFTALTGSLVAVFAFSSWQDKLIKESEKFWKGQ